MSQIHLLARKMICLIFLASIHFSECWVVKVINLTDEKITVDIHSTQLYPGWSAGRPTKRECEFIGKQVDPHASYDFDYKDVNAICIAPCTKSVTITSPIQLSSQNPLTSCSNVLVVVRKDESHAWNIKYHDWTAGIIKMLEERNRMPVKVRNIYDQFGDSPIQALAVFRQPIMSGIRELIKIITKNELKRLNYDELYHTGLIIKCRDQLIRLERNQTIASEIITPADKQKLEQKDVVLPRTIRFNEFINNAMENDSKFWKYNPVDCNCQLFVLQCLERNTIEVPDDLRTFIYQDAGQVLANSPLLRQVSTSVTSLANRIDRIIEGTSDITVQNATPYTIRVKTRYAGESTLLKSCLPDDFLLESGSEKTVSHGICLLEGIKVAASLKGSDALKTIPHEQLQKAADMFAEDSFIGRGKASANFVIRLGEGKKFIIEHTGNQHLSTAELQKFIAASRANPAPGAAYQV